MNTETKYKEHIGFEAKLQILCGSMFTGPVDTMFLCG